MSIKATNTKTGVVTQYECSLRAIAEYALANAESCLQIALSASDRQIKRQFGGEAQILDCIERYIRLYDQAMTMYNKQKEENNG